jgi:hypothetical protein
MYDIPDHIWPLVQAEHKRQAGLRPVNETEIPAYSLCRFCGSQAPEDWKPKPDDGTEFTVRVVDVCLACNAFRKSGPVFQNIDELIRRAMTTHLLWHHPEQVAAARAEAETEALAAMQKEKPDADNGG